MEYRGLTIYEKQRFNKNNICKICGQPVDKNTLFEVVVTTTSRFKVYNFFHRKCLISQLSEGGENNGKKN